MVTETQIDLYRDYNYSGDVNLEYGGVFFDLSNWHHGYVSAVRVQDLDSACGFTGAVIVEHVVIVLDRKYRKRPLESDAFDGDHWADALACCGLRVADLLEMDLHGKRMAIAECLLQYGRYDRDDGWDNYQTSWSTVVQCEHNGIGSYDGWEADVFLGAERCDLTEYVLRDHVNDTGFVRRVVRNEN